jgi:hypothetical protein
MGIHSLNYSRISTWNLSLFLAFFKDGSQTGRMEAVPQSTNERPPLHGVLRGLASIFHPGFHPGFHSSILYIFYIILSKT